MWPFSTELERCLTFLAEGLKWRIMSFVTPSGPGAFLVFNVLISASSSSFWSALVMHPSAGVFSESCFYFVSDMPCSFSGEFYCALLLVHVCETVCGSHLCQVFVLWLNDCLPLLWVIFVKQPGELQSVVLSFSILRYAVFSCHWVLVWWSLCRMNSALALLWFSTFASVGYCSCAILAWLTTSCISCSWLFHPRVYCLRLPRDIDVLVASMMTSVIILLRWCCSRLISLKNFPVGFTEVPVWALVDFWWCFVAFYSEKDWLVVTSS